MNRFEIVQALRVKGGVMGLSGRELSEWVSNQIINNAIFWLKADRDGTPISQADKSIKMSFVLLDEDERRSVVDALSDL